MRLRRLSGPMAAAWLALGLLGSAAGPLAGPAAAQAVAQGATGACADLGAAGTFIAGLATADTPGGSEALCQELLRLQERAGSAEAQAAELRTALQLAQELAPPPGSILLVDDGRGCPVGWTDVVLAEPEVFAGRVPVAAGFAEERVFRGFREVGGTEVVTLDETQLPMHSHALPLAFQAQRGGESARPGSSLGGGFSAGGSYGDQVPVRALAGREQTERTGAGAPHENMPPFVALFWCRKD